MKPGYLKDGLHKGIVWALLCEGLLILGVLGAIYLGGVIRVFGDIIGRGT